MALDDPRFRRSVRFTLKSIVVLLWTPIFVVGICFGATAFVWASSYTTHARLAAARCARMQRIHQIAWCVQLFAETRCKGDLSTAIDEYLDDARTNGAARIDSSSSPHDRILESDGITFEFAPRELLAHGFDPATTWIVRERVPEPLAPAFVAYADFHVAPLDR